MIAFAVYYNATRRIRTTSSTVMRAASLAFACMPKLGCPLCWPVLAAVCSFTGLRFSLLDPMITECIALAVLAVFVSSLKRHRITPHAGVAITSLLTTLLYRVFTMPHWVGYAGFAGILVSVEWSVFARKSLSAGMNNAVAANEDGYCC